MKEVAPFMNLGVQMIIPILLGALAGRFLDSKFGWTPRATVVLSLVGIAVGFYYFFASLSRSGKIGKKK